MKYKTGRACGRTIETLAHAATAIGVCFGVWAYFHTIHPVFEKENELLAAREEVGRLRQESENVSKDINAKGDQLAQLKAEVLSMEESLASTTEEFNKLTVENRLMRSNLDAMNGKVRELRETAVYAYMMKMLSGIVDEDIRHRMSISPSDNSETTLRERTVAFAREQQSRTTDLYEKAAATLVLGFAETKMKPEEDDVKELFHAPVWFRFEEDGKEAFERAVPRD